jgi:hypothetical protein
MQQRTNASRLYQQQQNGSFIMYSKYGALTLYAKLLSTADQHKEIQVWRVFPFVM